MNITKKDKVLFVDDEENILSSLKRALIREPFSQFFASSVSDALKILEENPDMAVVVSDLKMPEMYGLEFLKIVMENYPLTVRIVLSGFAELTTVLSALNTGKIYHFLTKPWKYEENFLPILLNAINYHKILIGRSHLLIEVQHLKKQNEQFREVVENVNELFDKDLEIFLENSIKINKKLRLINNGVLLPITNKMLQQIDEIIKKTTYIKNLIKKNKLLDKDNQ